MLPIALHYLSPVLASQSALSARLDPVGGMALLTVLLRRPGVSTGAQEMQPFDLLLMIHLL